MDTIEIVGNELTFYRLARYHSNTEHRKKSKERNFGTSPVFFAEAHLSVESLGEHPKKLEEQHGSLRSARIIIWRAHMLQAASSGELRGGIAYLDVGNG